MPISFGSVGDIIAICLLVKDLVIALDESRGSASEYQALKRELSILERALLEVELLSNGCSPSVKLNALYATTRKAAIDCRQPVQEFLDKIKKYEPSLGGSEQRSVFRDTAVKVKWQVSKKDEIAKFRAQINAHSSSINMLLATTNVTLSQINHDNLAGKLSEVSRMNQDNSVEHSTLLVQVQARLQETNKLLEVGNSITAKVRDSLKLDWFKNLGIELKNYMRKIIMINMATYQAVITIQGNISASTGRAFIQEPFILEDAIGRLSPVHLQFIDSWEAFESVLNLRFRNIQGYKKVLKKEYVLQEHNTRREVNRARPWNGAFLPGQRIDMSLIFDSAEKNSTNATCPSCHTASEGRQEEDILCTTCNIWFRRITEFVDKEPTPLVSIVTPRPHQAVVQFGMPSFNSISYGPKRPSQFPPLPSSTKRKMDASEIEEDDICQFKRIRLITKKDRIKHVPGPFSQQSKLEATLNSTRNQDLQESKAWSEYEALKASLGELHSDVLLCLNSLARLLRNHGKFSLAEELIGKVLAPHEEELLTSCPGILQLLLSGLMTVLVDQQKHDAADELWHRSIAKFRERTDEDSVNNLTRLFRQGYPLQRHHESVILQAAVFLPPSLSYKGPREVKIDMVPPITSDLVQLENPQESTETAEDLTPSKIASYQNSVQDAFSTTETKSQIPKTSVFEDSKPPKLSRSTKGKYNLPDFEVQHTIGTGSFARVHLVKSKHNQRFYAMKVFKKQQVVKMKQVEHTNDERRLLANLRNRFIPTMWGTFQDSKNLYMVSEFVEGGELFSLLRKSQRFPNVVAKFYAAEIVLAISYLHEHDIIYRDIKPENILITRHGHLKLCDFGFAKEVSDVTYTLCGTPDYLAPEVISSKGYGKSVDWWSLGILIHEMLCGFTPFWDGDSPVKTFQNILKGRVRYPLYIHPDAKNLMENLITADLSKRLGNLVNGSEDIKQHAWFAEVNWDRLADLDVDAPFVPPIQSGIGDTSQFDRYPENGNEPYGQPGYDEYFTLARHGILSCANNE